VDVVGDEFFRGEDDSAERAALAVDVLGRGIDDAVGAERERVLQHRRSEGVVDTSVAPAWWRMSATAAISTTSSVGLVGFRERRSWCWAGSPLSTRRGRCLRPASRRRRTAAAAPRRRKTRAEQRARGDDVVAGLELTHQRGGDRRHAAGGGARRSAPSRSAMRCSNIATVGWRSANR